MKLASCNERMSSQKKPQKVKNKKKAHWHLMHYINTFNILSIICQHDPNCTKWEFLLQTQCTHFHKSTWPKFCRVRILTTNPMYPFSQVHTLVELVLCKLRPTFISLLANPVPVCSLWGDVLGFPSPSTERMKKLFVIWASTNPFTLAIAQLLKTQRTEIAIDCVYTK